MHNYAHILPETTFTYDWWARPPSLVKQTGRNMQHHLHCTEATKRRHFSRALSFTELSFWCQSINVSATSVFFFCEMIDDFIVLKHDTILSVKTLIIPSIHSLTISLDLRKLLSTNCVTCYFSTRRSILLFSRFYTFEWRTSQSKPIRLLRTISSKISFFHIEWVWFYWRTI